MRPCTPPTSPQAAKCRLRRAPRRTPRHRLEPPLQRKPVRAQRKLALKRELFDAVHRRAAVDKPDAPPRPHVQAVRLNVDALRRAERPARRRALDGLRSPVGHLAHRGRLEHARARHIELHRKRRAVLKKPQSARASVACKREAHLARLLAREAQREAERLVAELGIALRVGREHPHGQLARRDRGERERVAVALHREELLRLARILRLGARRGRRRRLSARGGVPAHKQHQQSCNRGKRHKRKKPFSLHFPYLKSLAAQAHCETG